MNSSAIAAVDIAAASGLLPESKIQKLMEQAKFLDANVEAHLRISFVNHVRLSVVEARLDRLEGKRMA